MEAELESHQNDVGVEGGAGGGGRGLGRGTGEFAMIDKAYEKPRWREGCAWDLGSPRWMCL